MNDKTCPICNNQSHFRLKKENVDYFQCTNCKTIFCDALDNDNLIGGGAHEERNTQQNYLRIERINNLTHTIKKEDVFILDFGCGFGRLVDDLKKDGFENTFGYDLYNEQFSLLPEKNKYHIVVSVELFEHLSFPYVEIDAIYRSLKDIGYVYIETGFLNAAWDEGLKDEDNPYINPAAGHSTIYTHHGLDVLMASKGFKVEQKFNRHCHVYSKRTK